MANDCSHHARSRLEEDMQLLLECITSQPPSLSSQKQALSSVVDMCIVDDGKAKEMFRSVGLLEAVIELVKNTASLELRQTGLCTLAFATERDVTTQMILSSSDVFSLLNTILRTEDNPIALKSAAVVLLASIINNNSEGQRIVRETKLLLKLIDIFKSLIPLEDKGITDPLIMDYWGNIGKTLSVSCDNPQNELNQYQCISTIPLGVSLLIEGGGGMEPAILKPVIKLFTSCVANNSKAQEKLHVFGGLRAIMKLFITLVQQDDKKRGGGGEKRDEKLELILCLVQAILAATTNNGLNSKFLVDFHIVPLLLHLLSDEGRLTSTQQLSIIACLETLIETNDEHYKYFFECNGDSVLINLMADTMDETICKVVPVFIKMSKNRAIAEKVRDDDDADFYEARDISRPVAVNNYDSTSNTNILNEMSTVPLTTKINDWLEKAETQLPSLLPSLPPPPPPIPENHDVVKNQDQSFPTPSPHLLHSSVPATPKRSRPVSRVRLYREGDQSLLQEDTARVSNIQVSTDTSSNVCIGCDPLSGGAPITSRNFLPRLSLSDGTCSYHKMILESIITKKRATEKNTAVTEENTAVTEENTAVTEENTAITEAPTASHSPSTSVPSVIANKKRVAPAITPLLSPPPLPPPIEYIPEEPGISRKKRDNTTRAIEPMILSNPKDGGCSKPLTDLINRQQNMQGGKEKAKKIIYNCKIPHHKGNEKTQQGKRAKSLFFTEDEVSYLLEGVKKVGTRWRHILNAYPFQKGRTAMSLKDKYSLLTKKH